MDEPKELQDQQRRLWTTLSWNFPAEIRKALEGTPDVHSEELHELYSILASSQAKTPAHLLARIRNLPARTAKEMVDALGDLAIVPGGGEREEGCKPLFYDAERERLWGLVLGLFDLGYLGPRSDGSPLEAVSDFRTLHALYVLDAEDRRARRDETVGLRDPNHLVYHTTPRDVVEQWLRRLGPLVVAEGHVVGVAAGQEARADEQETLCVTAE